MVIPAAPTVPAAMGAFRGAVADGGDFQPAQLSALRAMSIVFGAPVRDPSQIPSLEPDAVAAVITDPAERHQVVQAMVVLAYMEHPTNPLRHEVIKGYADALGVDDKAIGILRDYVEEHNRRLLLDVMRYMPMAQWEKEFAKQEGVGTVMRSLLATINKGESPKLAAKFRALEGCPGGSLGRKVFDMYTANGWPFPGERYGVPEGTTVHDWVHVLSGYAPTPLGEIQVTAFICASSPDPKLFGALMLAVNLYEGGAIKLPSFPQAPSGGVLETPGAPEGLADAVRRGLAVNTDVMEGVDHWALKDEPVAELRERFGIIGKDEPAPGPDPGI